MKTQCTIEFKFGLVRNESMQVVVSNGEESLVVVPDDELVGSCAMHIDLPGKLTIEISGKNSEGDTIVDNDGNILEDKFVQISKIALDCFQLHEIFLYQKIKFLTNNGDELYVSYFGFNGTAVLDFDKPTVLEQYLSCKKD